MRHPGRRLPFTGSYAAMNLSTTLKRLTCLLSLLLLSAGPEAADKVDFGKEVYPILKNHCLACHSHGQVKGELRLDTVELMLKGGENGPAVVKGDSEKSLLYRMITGKEETVMPPRKNKVGVAPLSPEQIKLLKRWIDEGAVGSPVPVVLNTDPVRWRPLPPGLNPINSVAISPDGVYAACGRANQIFVYNVPAGGAAPARLLDPALLKETPASLPAADHDLILAMAFSPDGMQLASGGYRSIRLWRRMLSVPALSLDSGLAGATAAASPDGKWIATSGPNNIIKLWDASGGALARELAGHAGPVRSLAFSPDGTRLCSGSADKTLRIWMPGDGQSVHVDAGADVLSVSWASEGKRIAAGCADKLIRIWTVPAPDGAWEKPRELKAHGGPVTALCIVGTGKQILSGSDDGTVRLWDAESGKEIRKVDHGAPVTAVASQSDAKRWASAGGNAARLWKDNGEALFTLKGDRKVQEALAEAERTSAFSKEQIAYFKSAVQEHEKTLVVETDSAKKAKEKVQAAKKDVDQKQAAAKKAADAKAELEKTTSGPLAELKKSTTASEAAETSFSQAAKAAKAASDNAAQTKTAVAKAGDRKTAAEKAVAKLTPETPADEAKAAKDKLEAAKGALEQALAAQAAADKAAADAQAAAKTADEARKAAAKALGDLAEKAKVLDAQVKVAEKLLVDAAQAAQQAEQANSAAEHNDERLVQVQKKGAELLAEAKVAMIGAEADQKIADAAVEAAKKAATDSEKPVRVLAFSSDNRVLATSGADAIIHTWSTETGRGAEQYRGLESAPAALVYGSGGMLAAVVGARTLVWARHSQWTLERTIGTGGVDSPLMDRVLALAFSPDGKRLASGGGIPSRAGELKIWNPADGTLVREIKDAHSDTVFGVAYSRDGRFLASGAADRLVKVFDPAEGKLVKVFEGHTQHVLSVSWKRHGRTLVSSGADKVAKVWDMITGEQLKSIEGFRKEVTAACYLDSQNEILLASGDGQLRTAKEDGNKVRGFQFGKEYIESAAATPDGKLIVAGGSDSVLRVFESGKDKVLSSFDPP
jgi:WD40 repeat protein